MKREVTIQLIVEGKCEVEQSLDLLIEKLKEAKSLADEIASTELKVTTYVQS